MYAIDNNSFVFLHSSTLLLLSFSDPLLSLIQQWVWEAKNYQSDLGKVSYSTLFLLFVCSNVTEGVTKIGLLQRS